MFLSGGGGNSFECALSKGGSFKCVQNACRGREGVKKGQKTACALYVWPLYKGLRLLVVYPNPK